MLREIHALLNEADAVIHYNGTSFDIPRLNQEFSAIGLKPPSPTYEMDLYRVVRRKFSLPSNKLEYVVNFFKLGKKVKHPGMELWVGCMKNKASAWRLMEKYNKMDTRLLDVLYLHLRPWMDHHLNRGLYTKSPACKNCGGEKVIRVGYLTKENGHYQRYKCQDCGKWQCSDRAVKRLSPTFRG